VAAATVRTVEWPLILKCLNEFRVLFNYLFIAFTWTRETLY